MVSVEDAMRYACLLLLGSLAALQPACRPSDDDDSTGVVDDDDVNDDDDDVTPDPACFSGYEPLAVMDDFHGDIESIAVHAGSETFAVLTASELVLYDVSDPWNPVELETLLPDVLGSGASWIDIAESDWGYAVLGQTIEEGVFWAQTMKLEVSPVPALGVSSPWELGPDVGGGNTGARAVFADGDVVVVLTSIDATDGYVEYFENTGNGLSHFAWADFTSNRLPPGALVLSEMTAILQGSFRVHVAQPNAAYDYVEIGGTSTRPLRTEGGWFVPTIGGAATTPLYMLDVDTLTVQQVGETITGAVESDGGAHHAALHDGELFLAQVSEGLVRTDWDPPDISGSGYGGAATSAIWTQGIGTPGPVGMKRIERIDDVLFGLGPEGPGFGDAPPIGLLRICPQ
jgi:hypothetical protein